MSCSDAKALTCRTRGGEEVSEDLPHNVQIVYIRRQVIRFAGVTILHGTSTWIEPEGRKRVG
jgi:hypothetical protein